MKHGGPAGYENDFERDMKAKGFVIEQERGATWANADQVNKQFEKLDDDNPIGVDASEVKEYTLPPDPVPLRPYNADEVELRYAGKKEDYGARINHKLLRVWIMWAQLRLSNDLAEMLAREADKESDEYKVKCIIIDLVDVLAKVLTDTDTKEELKWLSEH